ncbi:hypothetical protein [Brucella thiophenivorans]|uniref:hypothetical protein n=1 Tax=Brucella thiophenivorans TaxID=571255 RepID=UPI000B99D0C0|nr:hypothetical protein [Brucella thiophenivorans]
MFKKIALILTASTIAFPSFAQVATKNNFNNLKMGQFYYIPIKSTELPPMFSDAKTDPTKYHFHNWYFFAIQQDNIEYVFSTVATDQFCKTIYEFDFKRPQRCMLRLAIKRPNAEPEIINFNNVCIFSDIKNQQMFFKTRAEFVMRGDIKYVQLTHDYPIFDGGCNDLLRITPLPKNG